MKSPYHKCHTYRFLDQLLGIHDIFEYEILTVGCRKNIFGIHRTNSKHRKYNNRNTTPYLRISTYLGTAMQNFRTLKTEEVVVVLVVSDRKNEYTSVRYFLLRFLPASLHLTTTTTATF